MAYYTYIEVALAVLLTLGRQVDGIEAEMECFETDDPDLGVAAAAAINSSVVT